jgi:uncharacterized protein (TIGR03790 family)
MKTVLKAALLLALIFPAVLTGQTLSAVATPASPQALPTPALRPQDIVILANSSIPESLELARYYAQKRSIPAENIAALPLPKDETITWPTYTGTLYNPLREWLLKGGWIAESGDVADDNGRRHGRITNRRTGYIVLMQGVPLRIADEKALIDAASAQGDMARLAGIQNPAAMPAILKHSFASVDSEIAAMPAPQNPVAGIVSNPLYRKPLPDTLDLSRILRTARLDGPDYASARGLIDSAMSAERDGLHGRAYVDMGGPYPLGEAWMADVAKTLKGLGYDTDVDEVKGRTFPAEARFDAPAFYFGWYSGACDGPFLEPGMKLAPGAIAMHLFSFSASSMDNRNNWTPALVERGAAGTVGNVYEPTLGLTHDFSIIMRGIAGRMSFADAAWASMPVTSWTGIIVGDPLYVPLPGYVPMPASRLPAGPLDQYVPIQRIAECERMSDTATKPRDALSNKDEALRMARLAYEQTPGFAIALKLAQLEDAAGNRQAAIQALAFMDRYPKMDAAQRSVAMAAARWLDGIKEYKAALDILTNLRDKQTTSPAFKLAVQKLGHEIATRSAQPNATLDWPAPAK